MPVIPKYRLIYFDVEGRGEISRLLFAEAGVNFEDTRVGGEEWMKMKPDMPFEQLPVLEFNGKMVAQSWAINRFLAKHFGLYGVDDWDRAKVDEFIGNIQDEFYKFARFFQESDEEKKKEIFAELIESSVKPLFAKIEKTLADSKSGWVVGRDMTMADIAVYQVSENYRTNKRLPPHNFTLEPYPHVQQLVSRVADRPNIKAYLAKKHHAAAKK